MFKPRRWAVRRVPGWKKHSRGEVPFRHLHEELGRESRVHKEGVNAGNVRRKPDGPVVQNGAVTGEHGQIPEIHHDVTQCVENPFFDRALEPRREVIIVPLVVPHERKGYARRWEGLPGSQPAVRSQ